MGNTLIDFPGNFGAPYSVYEAEQMAKARSNW